MKMISLLRFGLKPSLLASLAVLWIAGSLSAESFRVKNKIVSTGMSKGKVYMITGNPDWKASYLKGNPRQGYDVYRSTGFFSGAGRIAGYSGDYNPVQPVAVEEWLFNRGKNRFMQLLRFENERLVDIQDLSYGFGSYHTPEIYNPDWSLLKTGASSYEVLKEYGEPSLVETKPEITFARVFGPRGAPLYYQSAEVSWWYYNAGPNRLFRIVQLLNGRVVDVATEGYGLSER
jgi:hypothetical protein